jgi:four helix bundle protein
MQHVSRVQLPCCLSCAVEGSFHGKLSIVAEEADECGFWLEFIVEESLLEEPRVAPLLKEANELTRIFISGRKTVKDRSPEFNNQ